MYSELTPTYLPNIVNTRVNKYLLAETEDFITSLLTQSIYSYDSGIILQDGQRQSLWQCQQSNQCEDPVSYVNSLGCENVSLTNLRRNIKLPDK